MVKQFFYLLLVSLAFISISCGDDESPTPDVPENFEYVPLTVGNWYEYKLDSIIYDDFDNSVVTKEYDLRVEIGSEVVSEGETFTRFLRYIKPRNATQDFVLETVFFARVNNNRLETKEENLNFIKFIFPPLEGTTWAGNERISGDGNDNPTTSTIFYEGWEYTIVSTDQPATIQSIPFDRVTHINQSNEVGGPGAIRHLVSDEWYALNVGLVKKRMEMVVENCGQPGCSDKTKAVLDRENNRKGYILDLELTDYQIQ